MAVLLSSALQSSLPKWASLARSCQASGFYAYLHLSTATTITRMTAPYTQNLLTTAQQRCSSQNFIQRRNFFSYFKKRKSPEQFKSDDKVEAHYDLVYIAHSISYIQLSYGGVQGVAGMACVGLGAALYYNSLPAVSAILQEQPLEVAAFSTVNLMICAVILNICSWYPLRIYYSEIEDQFVAVFIGIHPLAVRHMKILPGEVKPKPPGRIQAVVTPWSLSLYSTSSKKIYLNVENFIYPVYYNKMLGYVRES